MLVDLAANEDGDKCHVLNMQDLLRVLVQILPMSIRT